jgi:CheY-like chemotaxis protein
MARPRIVVADDHDGTRAAIASLLASDFDVVATVADGQAAVIVATASHGASIREQLTAMSVRSQGWIERAVKKIRDRHSHAVPGTTAL